MNYMRGISRLGTKFLHLMNWILGNDNSAFFNPSNKSQRKFIKYPIIFLLHSYKSSCTENCPLQPQGVLKWERCTWSTMEVTGQGGCRVASKDNFGRQPGLFSTNDNFETQTSNLQQIVQCRRFHSMISF